MAMSKNLKKQWRVQVRRSRAHKWVNKGLFETREAARDKVKFIRENNHYEVGNPRVVQAYGFGNTRVVPYVKGGEK